MLCFDFVSHVTLCNKAIIKHVHFKLDTRTGLDEMQECENFHTVLPTLSVHSLDSVGECIHGICSNFISSFMII